jgi:hypothetical protein
MVRSRAKPGVSNHSAAATASEGAKVPILLIVGKKKAESRAVSIRRLGSQDRRW